MERKPTQRQVESLIRKHMIEYGNFLIKKNRAYGNSAFEAINIYSKGSALDLMKLRMDDKLKKMLKGSDLTDEKEDAAKDFCGYWHLMEILKEIEKWEGINKTKKKGDVCNAESSGLDGPLHYMRERRT